MMNPSRSTVELQWINHFHFQIHFSHSHFSRSHFKWKKKMLNDSLRGEIWKKIISPLKWNKLMAHAAIMCANACICLCTKWKGEVLKRPPTVHHAWAGTLAYINAPTHSHTVTPYSYFIKAVKYPVATVDAPWCNICLQFSFNMQNYFGLWHNCIGSFFHSVFPCEFVTYFFRAAPRHVRVSTIKQNETEKKK